MAPAHPHQVSLQSAYVLHRRPYRDTSLLLEIYSPDHGRLGLVARGARAPRSKTGNLLQPFLPLLLSWRGQGELPTLSGVESAGPAAVLQGDRLLSGIYLNELLMRLLHRNDPHPVLFAGYLDTLRALSEDADIEICLRRFECMLLQEIGYGLILDHDVASGEPIDAAASYTYLPDRGPMRHEGPERDGLLISGRSLQALAANHYPDQQTRQEAKRLLRAVLAVQLGDRPLKSRELFQSQAR